MQCAEEQACAQVLQGHVVLGTDGINVSRMGNIPAAARSRGMRVGLRGLGRGPRQRLGMPREWMGAAQEWA